MAQVQDLVKRFWSKVAVTPRKNDCWNWLGSRQAHPRYPEIQTYGNFWVGKKRSGGRMHASHRVAWQLTCGEIPDGLKVLHKCDNTACCNPRHLFLGTQMDNYQDMKRKGRERRARGSKHYMAKLTEKKVSLIRKLYVPGTSRVNPGNKKYLASKFHVSPGTIYAIAVSRRGAWRHV